MSALATIPVPQPRRNADTAQPAFAFHANPPLSLYIHLPWCVRKCPYCDFNSHGLDRLSDLPPLRRYVEALINDLTLELPLIWGRPIHSIFIGGGTPSLLPPDLVAELLSGVRALTNFAPDIEVTLEANPGTAEHGRFAAYREAGINRLSLGVQSFDDRALAQLGRIHGGGEARAAVEQALQAGFDSVNLDLMWALPGQDVAGGLADLECAIDYAPPHLSWYQLTIEPNTAFAHTPPALPDDDTAWDLREAGLERLGQAGYAHYEVSAHARPGHNCQHNLNYWRFGDYLGIGAGAHGKLTLPAEQQIVRRVRTRHPEAWLRAAGTPEVVTQTPVSPADALFEFMLNALRLRDGFTVADFVDWAGLPWSAALPAVTQAEARGLLERDATRVWPTELGRRFLNDLLTLFLPPDPVSVPRRS